MREYKIEKAIGDFKGLKLTLMRLSEVKNIVRDIRLESDSETSVCLVIECERGFTSVELNEEVEKIVRLLEKRWELKFEEPVMIKVLNEGFEFRKYIFQK